MYGRIKVHSGQLIQIIFDFIPKIILFLTKKQNNPCEIVQLRFN